MGIRKTILTSSLLCGSVLATPALAADLTGTWQIAVAGSAGAPKCMLTQKGTALSGTCEVMMSGYLAQRLGESIPTCSLQVIQIKVEAGTCRGVVPGSANGRIDGTAVKLTWKNSPDGRVFLVREFTGEWNLKDEINGKEAYRTEGYNPGILNVPAATTFTAKRQH